MDLIGELLRSSLLSELGDDEARVGKVRAAAGGMATAFRGPLRPLVPATVLAAFDEHTKADSTVLAAADEQLLREWETFRAAFPDTPTEVLRAVAVAGLQVAADDERDVLQAAWYTARTAAAQIRPGRWATLLEKLVDDWRSRVDAAMAETWVPRLDAVVLRMPSLPVLQEGTKIGLQTKLRDQVAELDRANYQTYANSLAEQFPHFVDALINGAEVLAGEAQRRAVAQVKDFASDLGNRLRDALGAQRQALTVMQLRTNLLWWRHSRFSERLDCGYDELAATADVVIAAAHDLHLQVPPSTPVSVEHVLADLVNATVGSEALRLDDLARADEAAALPADNGGSSPAPLLAAVRHDVRTPILGESDDLTPARAAVFLFRDLQARRLAAAPPPPPPTSDDSAE